MGRSGREGLMSGAKPMRDAARLSEPCASCPFEVARELVGARFCSRSVRGYVMQEKVGVATARLIWPPLPCF